MRSILNKQNVIAVLLSALAATNASAEETTTISPYIVNGTNAEAIDYPSFVSLFYDSIEYNYLYSTSPYCGGTLLNEHYVLTAAHCVYNNEEGQLFTMIVPQLQDERLYLDAEKQRVVEIYIPSNYNDSIYRLLPNDIAILKLSSALSIGTAIVQPTDERYRNHAEIFTAVGHGNTSSDNDTTAHLQKVNLDWVEQDVCAGAFDDGFYLNDTHLCFTGDYYGATDLLAGTCQGDSGGPIYWNDNGVQTQVGITSFGPVPCGDTTRNVTAVFTEIADYSDWINDVLNGQVAPTYTSTDEKRTAYLVGQGYDIRSNSSTSGGGSGGGSMSWLALIMLTLFGWKRVRSM